MRLIDLDSWAEVFATMRANKLRTALTAWGVFWGIFMLVVALGFGDGLRRGVNQKMEGRSPNSIFVWGQRTTIPFAGFKPGRGISLELDDIAAVEKLEGLEHLAPRLRLGGYRQGVPVSRGSETGAYEVYGDLPAIRFVQSFDVEGRFLNPLDISDARKVAVITRQVHEALFAKGEDPVGKLITIRGVAFEVIGMAYPRSQGDRLDRDEQAIYVPLTSFRQAFNSGNRINFFALTAKPGSDSGDLQERFRQTLMARHKVSPDDKRALGSFNVSDEFRKVNRLFIGIKFLLWLVGLATLFAGAIGVSNIMLIAVKERTKEIGVRKALGARPRQIVSLIMTETIALTTIAGYFGLIGAVGFLEVVGGLLEGADTPIADPQVNLSVAVIATVFLIISGAIAGIIPASHAARVSPIESLRAE